MLAVDDGQPKGSFAGLKQQWIAALSNRRGLQTEHCPKHHALPPEVSRNHRHYPISREEFVAATRPGLLRLDEESVSVKHEAPISEGGLEQWDKLRGCFRLKASSSRQVADRVLHHRHSWHSHLSVTYLHCQKKANDQRRLYEPNTLACHNPHAPVRACLLL